MRRLGTMGCALALAGCVVGPNYAPPAPVVPTAFSAPHAEGAPAEVARWWTAFGDPVLDGLIERGLKQNLDLAAAASRVRQARLDYRQTRARALPSVDATGGVDRTELSENGGIAAIAQQFGGGGGGPPGGIGLPGTGFTAWSLGLSASWELDLIGAARRGVEAARAREAAAEWTRRDSAVSVSAEIAQTYLSLRLLQRRYALALRELARQRETLSILEGRARTGLGPMVDVERQRTQIAAAEGSIDPIVADARASVHALGVLVGGTPKTFVGVFDQSPAAAAAVAVSPAVPPGLPSDLLRRRPDIRAAERRLAAATADIGVATADLYPRISLTGAAQLLSLGLSNLFEGDSVQLSAGAGVRFPLLDFGRRRATVGIRREQREQSYIAYQQTVLGALKETEDALVRLDAERRRGRVLAEGVRAARASVDAVQAQYRVGLTDLTAVLTAQQALLLAEDAQAQSDGAAQQQLVALYRALGGGWSENDLVPPLAQRGEGDRAAQRRGGGGDGAAGAGAPAPATAVPAVPLPKRSLGRN